MQQQKPIVLKPLPKGFVCKYLNDRIKSEFDGNVRILRDNSDVVFRIVSSNPDEVVDKISSMMGRELNKYIYDTFKESPVFYNRPMSVIQFEIKDDREVIMRVPEEL